MTNFEAEARALLTRASDLEARRQSALARGDQQTVAATADELARLWARYRAIEELRKCA